MIGERYELGEKVGKGGMGTVFKGVDTQTGQPVAIKRLESSVLERDPNLLERFRREGEVLRELNHPNIVKMMDAITDDDTHYLVMEYIAGGDLTSIINNGQLSINQILNIALDLSDALTRAHRLQIVHRDLKPANVLVTEDGSPRLTDFGIAHVASKDRVTATESIIGTIDYLAPEALTGAEVDTRTDIWAFGVMLFEQLTNQRPFTGETITQIMLNIMHTPTPDLEALRPDAPLPLIDLIYRMLEKDPQNRIASVRLIGAEIEAMLQGREADTSSISDIRASTPRFDATPLPTSQNHNLPAQTTPFVGREVELTELERSISDPNIRLMTIVAPGGMGKTRLAQETVRRQLPNFTDGGFFIPLAPLSDPANIVASIAEGVGYQFQDDGRSEKQQLLDFLSIKNLLLAIDNWEHVLEGAPIVTAILNAAPDVQIICTSRQRLAQQGEMLFHLSGMDFPDFETPEDAIQYAAIKLFISSANRVQPDFALNSDNLNYVARICRLVQGMPLGIVLAAAWLSLLTPEEIATEIQNSIDILEDEAGEFPERQQSIRAVFDYSWQQLHEKEQNVFMKMSVFRGGFTREAIQKITGANLRQLMGMVTKSLLRRDNETGRYQIHELLRQYAAEKLAASGGEHQTQDDHAQYYLEFLANQVPALKGKRQIATLNVIDDDNDNIQIAWRHGDIKDAIEALTLFCTMRGRTRDGQVLFQHARERFSNSEFYHKLSIRFPTSNDNIQTALETALELAKKQDDEQEIAFCLVKLGEIAHNLEKNPEQAIEYFNEGVTLYRKLNEAYYLGDALSRLGESYQLMGDFETTGKYVQESYAIQKESGDEFGQAKTLRALGMFAFMGGDFVESNQFTSQGYDIHLRAGNLAGQAEGLLFEGWLDMFMGEYEKGQNELKKSRELSRDLGLHSTHAWTLTISCVIDCLQNNLTQAKIHLDEAKSIQTNPFQQTGAGDMWLQASITWAEVTYQITSGDYADAKKNLHGVWQFSYSTYSYGYLFGLVPLAVVIYANDGKNEQATELLGSLYAIQQPQSIVWLQTWKQFNTVRESLKTQMGIEAFQTAWNKGQEKDLVTVAGEVLNDMWATE